MSCDASVRHSCVPPPPDSRSVPPLAHPTLAAASTSGFYSVASRSASPRATQVMGDSSPDADKLMRSQGVRALPSFHFWKGGKQVRDAPCPVPTPVRIVPDSPSHELPMLPVQVDSVSGAKTQALQDAIEQHM